LKSFFDAFLPAALFEPARPDAEFDAYAKLFNKSAVGIVFNAFDPQAGKEYLFINEAAVPWLNLHTKKQIAAGEPHHHRASNVRRYWAINGAAIRAAFQLFAYGFDWKVRDPLTGRELVLVDGAYHRQLILTELHRFPTIYAIRPLNDKYKTTLPTNQLEVQNLQCQMWMNGAVDAQKEAIDVINRIHAHGAGLHPHGFGHAFQKVDVRDVEIPTTYGFFDYFIETMVYYQAGLAQGRAKL
jgi:hypothetical protein